MSRRRGDGPTEPRWRRATARGASWSWVRRWLPGHLATVLVAAAGLGLTASVTTLSHLNYLHTEHRALVLEANLTQSALAVGPVDLERRLGKAVTEASLTHGSRSLFEETIATSVGRSGPLASAELLELSGDRPTVLARAGAPPVSATGSAAVAQLCQTAVRVRTLAVRRIVRPGVQRLAYAMAATAPGGETTYVVYGEQVFPANRRVSVPSASPDSDLNVAIYFGRTISSAQLVEASATTPLGGTSTVVQLPFGNQVMTIVVSPRGSLVGVLSESVAWIFLGLGLVFTAVAVAMTEWMARRRRRAERTASLSRSLYRDQRAMAETLQRALLPRRLPQPEGFEVSARYRAGTAGVEVGGDWYDVVEDGGDLFFSVGDVSGRGLDAAAVMAQLRHAIGTHGFDGADPAAVLAKVTRMVSLEQHGRFATVLCGRLRLSTGEMSLANAGHVTPLVVTSTGASVLDIPPDPPLGVGTAYRTHSFRLAPGQTFLAITDGLVERRGEPIDHGMERLRACISGTLALSDLLDALLAQLVPDGAHDDIAMLALRRCATVSAAVGLNGQPPSTTDP